MNTTKVDFQTIVDNMDNEEKFLYDIEETKFKLIQNLAKCRQLKGLTQKDIADITGMSQQAVSRIEKYGNEPSLANLLKYMKALGLDINNMFKKIKL